MPINFNLGFPTDKHFKFAILIGLLFISTSFLLKDYFNNKINELDEELAKRNYELIHKVNIFFLKTEKLKKSIKIVKKNMNMLDNMIAHIERDSNTFFENQHQKRQFINQIKYVRSFKEYIFRQQDSVIKVSDELYIYDSTQTMLSIRQRLNIITESKIDTYEGYIGIINGLAVIGIVMTIYGFIKWGMYDSRSK